MVKNRSDRIREVGFDNIYHPLSLLNIFCNTTLAFHLISGGPDGQVLQVWLGMAITHQDLPEFFSTMYFPVVPIASNPPSHDGQLNGDFFSDQVHQRLPVKNQNVAESSCFWSFWPQKWEKTGPNRIRDVRFDKMYHAWSPLNIFYSITLPQKLTSGAPRWAGSTGTCLAWFWPKP